MLHEDVARSTNGSTHTDHADRGTSTDVVLGVSVRPVGHGAASRLAGVALRVLDEGVLTEATFHARCKGMDRLSRLIESNREVESWVSRTDASVVAIKSASIAAPARRRSAAAVRSQIEGALVTSLVAGGSAIVLLGDSRALAGATGCTVTEIQRFALTFPLHLRDAAFAALSCVPAPSVSGAIPAR